MKAAFRRLIARLFERQVRRLIARHHLRVVAVAGSVGKTTTKMAVATVLRRKYRTLVHEGNYNSEIGLPLSVFELSVPRILINPFAWAGLYIRTEQMLRHYRYEVLVLELGTDHPGEIARYLRYLSPEVGVITAVTPEHMEYFPGGIDEVAAEELTLVGGSKQVVANYDDILARHRHTYIDPHSAHFYYGAASQARYRVKLTSTDPVTGTVCEFDVDGRLVVKDLKLAVYGLHSAKTALAAYTVGRLMGLSERELAAGLAKIHPVAGRMNPLKGINGSAIIDDTYNSSPEAVVAGMQALAAAQVTGRRIAVMGSMNELGADSPRYHQEAGAVVAGADLLVTVGDLAGRYLGPGAVAAGLDPSRLKVADSPYAAGEYLKLILQPGDVVFAKGSQNGVFAEEALKPLLANPADTAQLVRQSPGWLRTKAKQFSDAPL